MRTTAGSWPGQDTTERPASDARQPRANPGHDFTTLSGQFLAHLAGNRRCSPLTISAYRCDYRKTERLLRQAGHGLDVRSISTGDLQVCLASLGHLSPASIERLVYSLNSFFKWVHQQGIVAVNPALALARPQRAHKVPRQFTRGEADRLMAACETLRERLVIGLLRYCGLRRAELLSLNVSDVAADFSSLRVEGKGRRQRVIPMHDCLKALLQEHLRGLTTEDGALIANHAGKHMSATSFWRLFRRLLGRAGLSTTGLTPHGLRHHFASELIRAGVDVATVAELLGHSNISVTSVYLHSDLTTKRAAINSLAVVPAAIPGGTGPDSRNRGDGNAR